MRYLHLKRISKQETQFGDDLLIKMIQIRDEDGKFIRNAKLNDSIIKVLLRGRIEIK